VFRRQFRGLSRGRRVSPTRAAYLSRSGS
jgi:hypothetical protein